ncbi:MAG TPA: PadR family transcriptional regulator [Cytophagales bacterium]|nr:PadR family transcriptional regulator [Cytophagales bacterium]HAP58904.1 PadR family transcriptional regulator [Cytophagales bacterium]
MKGTNLGEFEELVLLMVGNLHGNAYGITLLEALTERTGRKITISSVHTALYRLEEKGFLRSEMGGASQTRGGRTKRLYVLTAEGHTALVQTRELRDSLWGTLPDLGFK